MQLWPNFSSYLPSGYMVELHLEASVWEGGWVGFWDWFWSVSWEQKWKCHFQAWAFNYWCKTLQNWLFASGTVPHSAWLSQWLQWAEAPDEREERVKIKFGCFKPLQFRSYLSPQHNLWLIQQLNWCRGKTQSAPSHCHWWVPTRDRSAEFTRTQSLHSTL